LQERYDNIEAIMIDNTIIRLYELLLPDTKSALFGDIINLDILNHSVPTLYFLIRKTEIFNSRLFQHNLKDLSKIFWNLHQHPSTCNWKHLVREYFILKNYLFVLKYKILYYYSMNYLLFHKLLLFI